MANWLTSQAETLLGLRHACPPRVRGTHDSTVKFSEFYVYLSFFGDLVVNGVLKKKRKKIHEPE